MLRFNILSVCMLFMFSVCSKQVVAQTPSLRPTSSPLSHCELDRDTTYHQNVVTQNGLSIATSAISALSAIGCLAMIIVIFAYSKTRIFRERLLLGMALANLVFSVAQIPPIWTIDLSTCWMTATAGEMVTLRFMWFGAKFSMVFYEICVIGSSVLSMHIGQLELDWWSEATMHAVCFLAFLITFLGPYAFMSSDLDEWQKYGPLCFGRAIDKFEGCQFVKNGKEKFDKYQQMLMSIWLACASVAILLSIISRIQLKIQLNRWHQESAAATEQYARDYWAESDKPFLEKKVKLMNLQKQAYLEITKPLEPYVVMFVLFMAPAIPMATKACAEQQGPYKSSFCMQPCELVLTFRAYATVLIYFSNKDARAQLFDVKKLCRKFSTRVREMMSKITCAESKPGRVAFANEIESVRQFEKQPDYVSRPVDRDSGQYAYASAAPS